MRETDGHTRHTHKKTDGSASWCPNFYDFQLIMLCSDFQIFNFFAVIAWLANVTFAGTVNDSVHRNILVKG